MLWLSDTGNKAAGVHHKDQGMKEFQVERTAGAKVQREVSDPLVKLR